MRTPSIVFVTSLALVLVFAMGTRFGRASAAPDSPAMHPASPRVPPTKWDHNCIVRGLVLGDGALTKDAKELGWEGWELVSLAVTVEDTALRRRQYIMCFKRPSSAP